MSKELDKVNEIYHTRAIYKADGTTVIESSLFNLLVTYAKEALQRLESIDNANPSEALIGLQHIKKYYIPEPCSAKTYDYLDTIKQALLKAQEPKQYLKWEDLEFSEERQEIPVRMGETIYILVLRKTDGGNKIAKLLSPKRNYMGEWGDIFYEEAKQFFNDLHLERVEE